MSQAYDKKKRLAPKATAGHKVVCSGKIQSLYGQRYGGTGTDVKETLVRYRCNMESQRRRRGIAYIISLHKKFARINWNVTRTSVLEHKTESYATLRPRNMATTNLCFTQLFIGHLKHDYSCFLVKAFKHYLLPDELL